MQNAEYIPASSDTIDSSLLNSFFAPVEYNKISSLIAEYEARKDQITEVHALITQSRVIGVMDYFFSGNCTDQYGSNASLRHISSFEQIFLLEGALNELTSSYWNKVLRDTGLFEIMPQKRREQWFTALNAWREKGYERGKKPDQDMGDFTANIVQSTIDQLMADLPRYVAERVDGIFQNLSRSHVTNSPAGFSKRMIMKDVYSDWGSAKSYYEDSVHDLRVVISKFMGRDDPSRATTSMILKMARAEHGQWHEIDGGSCRLRAYKIGTVHFEVHPEMAYRLNSILAHIHPTKIPESFRRRPEKPKGAGFQNKVLFERPFSNAVATVLAGMEHHKQMVKTNNFKQQYEHVLVRNAVSVRHYGVTRDKHVLREVREVMQALGGVELADGVGSPFTYWQFSFNALSMIHSVAALGYLPDHRSHNYYPTPPEVAQQLVDWLDIGLLDTVCEPQAGQGGIADLLPKDRTRCVEISPLHCEILRQKGHNVTEGDFLEWKPGVQFSVLAMNPPFSEGRWQAHLQHAGSLVEAGGRLGAVLPVSARRKAEELLPDFTLEFSQPIDNAFQGTSISVLLLKAVKIKP